VSSLTKRNTVSLSAELESVLLVSYDPQEQIDDFLDEGGSFIHPEVRAFPPQWTERAVKLTRAAYLRRPFPTPLRAAELGVSGVYLENKYSASWNAPLFPEVPVLEACGPLKRDETITAKAKAKAQGKAKEKQPKRGSGAGAGGETPQVLSAAIDGRAAAG
jgi:hypothetical protein